MKVKRCLMFLAVMFTAALFGVYGSGNVASAKQGTGNNGDKNNSTVSLLSTLDQATDHGHIKIDGTIVIGGDATNGFIVPRLTAAQRDLIPALNGMIIYNTDDDKFEGFEAGAWVALGFPVPGAGPGPVRFACGVDQVADADGNLYDTVEIGGQCWMAENLNVGAIIAGTSAQTDNGVIEKYCFDNDLSICATEGALYQWDEAMQYSIIRGSHGICPDGWHLPSDNDWKILEIELGMTQADADGTGYRGTNEGDKLKTAADCFSRVCGTSGFQALFAGYRIEGSPLFNYRGFTTLFWSTTEQYAGAAARIRKLGSDERVYRGTYGKKLGLSVRCVKD
ncbi:MAG: hypothetical protein GY941_14895 [Planctomycetes bacterium]|nr:hypothetical protein [Planctomycetota bacterium]